LTGAGTTSISGTYPNFTITSNDQYVGTVTSVAVSGGTTGLTTSGGPITTSGTITIAGTLALANGGTGASLTDPNADRIFFWDDSAGATTFLTVGSGLAITGTTLEATGAGGSVTSVSLAAPTGFTVSGSPVTTSGTLTLAFDAGYSLPTTTKQSEWDTAYTDRLKWDGGATGLNASTGRTSLGGSTVGQSFFTLTNPSAITFPRMNADNTVSSLSAADFRTAIGAGTSSTTGTVTSVATGTGLTGGPITTTGTVSVATNGITNALFRQSAGYAIVGRSASTTGDVADIIAGTDHQVLRRSGTSIGFGSVALNQSAAVTGTLAIANGGTNATATPTNGGVTYGTGTAYAFTAAGTAGQVLLSNGAAAPSWGGISGGTF
jgi:hypothetical protein